MMRIFKFLSGTKSIQRKLLIIFISVSIPLFALLYYVQHVSQTTIMNHIDEIDDIRMAETSNNIRDMLKRIFMSTNMFISDPLFIEALEIEDPYDIVKTNTYFHTIDRLQYAFFLNENYTIAVIDKRGNEYISEPARMNLSKAAVSRIIDEQIPEEALNIMDSYRWYLFDVQTVKGETERILTLHRIVFNPETAAPKGRVVVFVPFAYIEATLERQQGYIEIASPESGTLYRSLETKPERAHDAPESYLLEPTNWTLNYWKSHEVAAEKTSLFRWTTYIAIGAIMVLMIGVTAIVINEIRKALFQIKSLSQQLARNNAAHITVKGDYHIVELSHSLQQLVHNLNTARKNYETAANEKKQLEMQMLQHQINPHFLLNTLSTFRWLADSAGMNKLSSLIIALSHMLRQQLYDSRSYWTVEEELEYIGKYVEIQKSRFGENISVILDVEPGTEKRLLLKMLIQPIIENCFEHAFADRDQGTIVIRVASTRSGIAIDIEDDGCGFEAGPPKKAASGRKSIGLENIKNRIALHYGGASRLDITNCAEGGTCVTLILERREVEHL